MCGQRFRAGHSEDSSYINDEFEGQSIVIVKLIKSMEGQIRGAIQPEHGQYFNQCQQYPIQPADRGAEWRDSQTQSREH